MQEITLFYLLHDFVSRAHDVFAAWDLVNVLSLFYFFIFRVFTFSRFCYCLKFYLKFLNLWIKTSSVGKRSFETKLRVVFILLETWRRTN